VITKNPTWNFIVKGLREIHRTKKITDQVMKKIKNLEENKPK